MKDNFNVLDLENYEITMYARMYNFLKRRVCDCKNQDSYIYYPSFHLKVIKSNRFYFTLNSRTVSWYLKSSPRFLYNVSKATRSVFFACNLVSMLW